jgi:lysine 6-dehydrogenase
MTKLLRGHGVCVSCVPYMFNLGLTKAAIRARSHFCDLGGNNDIVASQLALGPRARKAGVTVVPDCGLAPGLVSILARDGFDRLDRCDAIHIRVGGLPRKPKPPLDYAIVFSANGLINEYSEPCLVLRNGRPHTRPPLGDIETLRFPRPFGRLEAFNTSGGSSTLPETFRGKVKDLDYKTIRYPGHCERFRLLFDLGLCSNEPVELDGKKTVPRRLLIRQLEETLGFETDDVVLLRVDAVGTRKRKRRRVRYQLVDYADRRTGLTAMMRCTGFPAAVVALMLGRGQATATGCLPGEKTLPPGRFIRELRQRGIGLTVRTRTI